MTTLLGSLFGLLSAAIVIIGASVLDSGSCGAHERIALGPVVILKGCP